MARAQGRGDRAVPAAAGPGAARARPADRARRSRSWTRSGSSSTGSPARSPISSRRRGTAAARAHLRLTLDLAFALRGTPAELVVEQRFPEPTADAEAIERLLLARLERTPPPAPVARIELELAGVEPAVGQQLPLFVPQAARNARLGWQLARLALTFGEDRVRRVAIADPDAPLRRARWTWRP